VKHESIKKKKRENSKRNFENNLGTKKHNIKVRKFKETVSEGPFLFVYAAIDVYTNVL